MVTQQQMNLLVPEKLRDIEGEYGVKVLYAADTGSRAWGLASPDSDFDVRFIYIRPRSDYLRLDPPRDVIETPIDDTWDVSGWDLQKALRLLWKSNPALFEWLASEIRYGQSDFDRRIAPLTREYFVPKSMISHYFHMARNNIRTFLRGETVRPKKYFYALRPVLACLWIRDSGSPPPILYSQLADACLPARLKPASDALLEMKISLPEGGEIPPVKEIDAFLDERLAELESGLRQMPDYKPKPWEPLNRFFLSELERAENPAAAN